MLIFRIVSLLHGIAVVNIYLVDAMVLPKEMKNDLWLSTKAASDALGISMCTLKRKRDCSGGFLENGKHWCAGSTSNSPLTWCVEQCRKELNRRGMYDRKQKSPSGGNCEFR